MFLWFLKLEGFFKCIKVKIEILKIIWEIRLCYRMINVWIWLEKKEDNGIGIIIKEWYIYFRYIYMFEISR